MNLADLDPVPKTWGEERWVENNSAYCCKVLVLNEGGRGSLHYHRVKDETFLVVEGRVLLELEGRELTLAPGDFVRIRPGQVHRFTGLEASRIVEASTRHDDEDTYRIELSGR